MQCTRHSSRGSSPPTRGAPAGILINNAHSRIIPAYAGSTRKVYATYLTVPDHPRLRGEHPATSGDVPSLPGSSPPTRGAPC